MEIKTLAKNTAILATPKILIFFVGILRSKLIAVLLGTTGFGIVNQLTSTINFIRQSTLSFMPDGMVKLIAKERSEDFKRDVIAEIIKTYFMMVIPVMILVVVLSFLFIDQLTIFVLGDLKYKNYLLISLFAIPLSFVTISLRSLLKSFKEIKAIALSQVYIMLINLVVFIPLIYFYKIWGAVVYVTLSFIVVLFVTFFIVKKNVFTKYNISIKSIKKSAFSKVYSKELLAFIGVGMIAGTFRVIENMGSRAIVVNELGIDKIGVYAPITKWQALFLGFILPSVYTYLYPRLSEAKSDSEITSVINDVIRMITFLTLPFVIIGITTREWIIPLFYSQEFSEAAIYLPFHFAFLLMAVWTTIFEQIFAPTGRLKIFLFFVVVISMISLSLVYFFVPRVGLYGYMLRFTITPFLFIITFFIYWKNEISFKLKKENILIIFYSILSVSVLVICRNTNNYLQVLLGFILIGSMVFIIKPKEKIFLVNKLFKLLRIKK